MSLIHDTVVTLPNNPAYEVSKNPWNAEHKFAGAGAGEVVFVDGSGHAATSADFTFDAGASQLTIGNGGLVTAGSVVAGQYSLGSDLLVQGYDTTIFRLATAFLVDFTYPVGAFGPYADWANSADLGSVDVPWRTGYFGTSVVAPLVTIGGAVDGQLELKDGGGELVLDAVLDGGLARLRTMGIDGTFAALQGSVFSLADPAEALTSITLEHQPTYTQAYVSRKVNNQNAIIALFDAGAGGFADKNALLDIYNPVAANASVQVFQVIHDGVHSMLQMWPDESALPAGKFEVVDGAVDAISYAVGGVTPFTGTISAADLTTQDINVVSGLIMGLI